MMAGTDQYRAQVMGVRGWVDGGLFTKERDAIKDAQRLADQYGQDVRVIPVPATDEDLPGLWSQADLSGGWADAEGGDDAR